MTSPSLTADQALDEFRAARGAMLTRPFHLVIELHSAVFLQKMFVFQDPARTERLCRALAEKAREAFGAIDVVASRAPASIVPATRRRAGLAPRRSSSSARVASSNCAAVSRSAPGCARADGRGHHPGAAWPLHHLDAGGGAGQAWVARSSARGVPLRSTNWRTSLVSRCWRPRRPA